MRARSQEVKRESFSVSRRTGVNGMGYPSGAKEILVRLS
jgi:hypothetical protein